MIAIISYLFKALHKVYMEYIIREILIFNIFKQWRIQKLKKRRSPPFEWGGGGERLAPQN
jgi:hypothetical protein